MRIPKWLKRTLLVLLALLLAAGAGGAFYFLRYLPASVAPRSFPQVEGELQLAGLDAPAEVLRDSMGVAHIYASTQHDLFFAQGYVHAQERFWQMDAWRHIGSGTLSEMFGKGQVETDAFLRTLGWRQTAEAEWQGLGEESRAILESYADGVNAYLKDHSGDALSLEYAVLKLLSPAYRIAPWTPVNSLTWGKAMAWDLRGNMEEEIERAVLLKALTPEQVDALYPPYPQDHPVIVNNIGAGSGGVASQPKDSAAALALADPGSALEETARNIALLDGALGPLGDGIGSNSWVLSGALTDSGSPLLANDPHLGIQMPSIWYQVGLHCQPVSNACPFEVAGFSFAGVPGVIIGHNARVAWGFTNVGPDVMDLYIEKVNPENPNQYEVNGQWVDFETREETIQVSGGEAVTLTVRSTRHGPVVSDSFGPLKDAGDPKDKAFVPFAQRAGIELPERYAVALKWTALTPSTPFESVWGLDRASNWEEFRAAAAKFHVPAQNLVYADVDGNIGYQMPGDIPLRANGDGRLPVPGWTDDYEWTGFIPFAELPYTLNPDEGFIVTANNQVHPRDYPYLVSTDWDYGFRAARIVEMITAAGGKVGTDGIQTMQADALDANAVVFAPLMLQALDGALTPQQAAAKDLLAGWDYQATADSGGAAVFEASWRHLLQATFSDDLPEDYWPEGGSRWNEVMRNLPADSSWWDDKATPEVEGRADMLRRAFEQAVAELGKAQGKDPAGWRWGAMHTATFKNQTLGESGVGLIERLFNRGPFPTGGGEALVNATGWTATEGYAVDWLPSMRMIVDLGDLDASQTVHTTGQSGHAYHAHYADMAPLWSQNRYSLMHWSRAAVEADTESRLVLRP